MRISLVLMCISNEGEAYLIRATQFTHPEQTLIALNFFLHSLICYIGLSMFPLLSNYFAQICGWCGNVVLDIKTERRCLSQLAFNVISPYSHTRVILHMFPSISIHHPLYVITLTYASYSSRGLNLDVFGIMDLDSIC